ncbi:MAG: flap endonuclease-1 [Nanoarchaeota archaeon]|nr:flap endonuclease-1 [Nanoarchaeota archaeon]
MGVQITELLERKPMAMKDLKGKVIAIDAYNQLYQFLSSIRQQDGRPLSDSKGNTTSHLVGLFSRTTKMMEEGLKPSFVFDGPPPKLKSEERKRRRDLKAEAEKKYEAAVTDEDIESMRKYAARTSRLTKDLVDEARQLIRALGLPAIDAPCEGEAQAAELVKEGEAFALVSQDADGLLFGSPRLVRNLSVQPRKKLPGKMSYTQLMPELIDLEATLKSLGMSREQLIALAMLVGTDYNMGGVKGIGPKKAMVLVKKHGNDFNALFKETAIEGWEDIFGLFTNMEVKRGIRLEWEQPDEEAVMKMLVDGHEFNPDRVRHNLSNLMKAKEQQQQKGLGDYF